jgi:hypothetical protein
MKQLLVTTLFVIILLVACNKKDNEITPAPVIIDSTALNDSLILGHWHWINYSLETETPGAGMFETIERASGTFDFSADSMITYEVDSFVAGIGTTAYTNHYSYHINKSTLFATDAATGSIDTFYITYLDSYKFYSRLIQNNANGYMETDRGGLR